MTQKAVRRISQKKANFEHGTQEAMNRLRMQRCATCSRINLNLFWMSFPVNLMVSKNLLNSSAWYYFLFATEQSSGEHFGLYIPIVAAFDNAVVKLKEKT